MQDTPQHVADLQYQIFLSKTPDERFALGIAYIEHHWNLMRAGIKTLNPDFSEEQITTEIIKRMKQQDQSLNWLDLQ